MLGEIVKAGRYLGQSMRLMCGLPEYDTTSPIARPPTRVSP